MAHVTARLLALLLLLLALMARSASAACIGSGKRCSTAKGAEVCCKPTVCSGTFGQTTTCL